MKNLAGTLILGLALSAAAIGAADNSLGTWKRNMEKSKYSQTQPSNPYTSQTTVREAAEGGSKVSSKGMRKDGTAADGSYTATYDGKPATVTGNGLSFDTISVKQIDANTFTVETRKSGGKYHTSGKTVISPDGKVMTNSQKGTNADGKPISFTIVYDKQ